MNTTYQTTVLKVSIHRKGDSPIFGEYSTHVSVDDEASGPYIVIEQQSISDDGKKIRLEFDEAKEVWDAIEMLRTEHMENPE